MAFEDVYAEVLSASSVAGYYDSVNADYLPVLAALLPPGPIWNVEEGSEKEGLLEALSYALTRIEARGRDLFEEIDPRTTVELLDDWERVFGLPGDNPDPPTTLAGRREALHGIMLGNGDPAPSLFVQIAAGLGYTVTFAHNEYDPFVAGSAAGDPLTQSEWAFLWSVATLGAVDDETLKWALAKTVPAHTRLLFKIAAATWDVRTSGFGATLITAVTYGRNVYVAVGGAGKLSSSPDGETWTARTSQFGANQINGVFLGSNLLVAHGSAGKVSTSSDGITWTLETTGFSSVGVTAGLYADARFLLVGDSAEIVTTTQAPGGGYSWDAQTPDTYAGDFTCAVHAQDLFVIGGTAGEIQTSPDGYTWTSRTSQFGANALRDLAYGDGTFVAVGDAGNLSSSTNGTTWTSRTSQFSTSNITAVIYAGEIFVAVGDGGKISTSTDGETWVARTSGLGDTISGVAYGEGLFVVVDENGSLAVSFDGTTWTTRTSGFSGDIINAVAYGAYRFVAVGDSGKLTTTQYGEL